MSVDEDPCVAVQQPKSPRRARVSTGMSWAGDAASIAILFAILIYLEGWDGGSRFTGSTGVFRVGLLAVASALVVITETGRLGRWGALLIASWGLGGILALLAAQYRADFVLPTITMAMLPVVALVTMRIWRRTWGPRAMALLFAISFAIYWYHSLLAWWGGVLGTGSGGFWLPLSWHNQSAILMAALGLMAIGVAVESQGGTRILAIAGAGLGLAGVWLTGSRGGMLACAAGVVAIAIGGLRRERRLAVLAVAAAIAVGAFATFGLTHLPGGPQREPGSVSRQPIEGREAATSTLRSRLYSWDAAWQMFIHRPLTGWGPGSYRGISRRYTSPEVELTAYAHNNYLEALAEGGATALPVLIAAALAAVAAIRLVLRRTGARSLRSGTALGSAGALIALIIHAAVDFDWTYLVLAALGGITFGITWQSLRSEAGGAESAGSPIRPLRAIFAIPLILMLLVGVIAGSISSRGMFRGGVPPWEVTSASSQAISFAAAGDIARAKALADQAMAWNPASGSARTADAIVRWRSGEGDATAVATSLVIGQTDFDTYNTAAQSLIEGGEPDVAMRVIEAELDYIHQYPRWSNAGIRTEMWSLFIRASVLSGCDQGRETLAQAIESEKSAAMRTILEREYSRWCPAAQPGPGGG